MKRLFLAMLTLLTIGSVFAQTMFPLFINCSEMGADVYINNKLYTKTSPNMKVQLPPAVYNIKIVKDGFVDFSANTTVKASRTDNVLSANLIPLQPAAAPAPGPGKGIIPSFMVRISCNAQGAQVFVDGALAGTAPGDVQVKLGKHELRVSAPGYLDSIQTLDMKAAIAINVNLQSTGAQFTVQSNVNGADVFINGNPAGKTPFAAQLPNGSYSVLVRAAGYMDFSQNIVINGGPFQVNANLQGQNQLLTVQSNVAGATVFINGNSAGKTPFAAQVPSGSYSVQVKAPGYVDFGQNVVVGNGPAQVNATLQAQSFQVNVDANVKGALVLINGNQVGQTPYVTLLPQGNYTVLVRAASYYDFQAQITVNGPQAVNAALQPLVATWALNLPATIVNKDIKPGKPREVEVWIDGVLQADSLGSSQILPGRHVVRLVSGGLAVETQFDAVAGRAYTIEPQIGVSVK